MTSYILSEKVDLNKAFYIHEMDFKEMTKYMHVQDVIEQRHQFNLIKKFVNDLIPKGGISTSEYKFSNSMMHFSRIEGTQFKSKGYLLWTIINGIIITECKQ